MDELTEQRSRDFRLLANSVPTVMWISNTSNEIVFLNESWMRETGQAVELGLGFGWLEVVHPDDLNELLTTCDSAVSARVPYTVDFRARRSDGEYRWASISGSPHYGPGEQWIGYVGNVVDVHDRVVQAQQLVRMAEFRRSAMAMIEESLSALDADQFYDRILQRAVGVIPGAQAGSLLLREQDDQFGFAAAQGYDLTGLKAVRLTENEAGFEANENHQQPRIVVRPHALQNIAAPVKAVLEDVGRSQDILSVLVVPIIVGGVVRAYLSLDNFEDEEVFGAEALEMARVYAGHVGSLIERFALQEDLHRLAYEDLLTSTPNRARFTEHLQLTLARWTEGSGEVALLFVDLDNLKPINDSLGHRAGDEVLRQVATRLAGCAPSGVMLARLGGDEFTFLLEGQGAERSAVDLAEQVLAELAEPIQVGHHQVHIGASIGISVYPRSSCNGDDLLRHADIAMYHAKQSGKNTFMLFRPEMEAAPLDRLLLEEALREALEKDEFVLHFQPRVDMRTGKIVSLEALVRWQHPQRGLIPPALFIPMAETTNLIQPLGKRIFEMAIEQARAWRAEGFDEVKLAVNLGARQLEQIDLVETLEQALLAAGVPPCALEVEVLESVAMKDVPAVASRLSLLKELGVNIALDDFGTGYSNLAYLQELPLDTLKIDQSFLQRQSDGTSSESDLWKNMAVLQAIRAMANAFGMRVVVEGVETEEQWRFLEAIGCDEAQGFLLSPPVPSQALRSLLDRQPLIPRLTGWAAS